MAADFRISVLISGGGTTLKNLIEWSDEGRLDAKICQVVSSSSKAAGNQFAVKNSIPLDVLVRSDFANDQSFSNSIFDICRRQKIDLVVMGGFLKLLVIPDDFENRVINIHPSLIPAFAGAGYYGMNVHRSVIEFGCRVSGCTVHFVDNQYDHGPIIEQRPVLIESDDSAESLQHRIFKQECELYPEVINLIANGQIRVEQRKVLRNQAAC